MKQTIGLPGLIPASGAPVALQSCEIFQKNTQRKSKILTDCTYTALSTRGPLRQIESPLYLAWIRQVGWLAQLPCLKRYWVWIGFGWFFPPLTGSVTGLVSAFHSFSWTVHSISGAISISVFYRIAASQSYSTAYELQSSVLSSVRSVALAMLAMSF